MNATQIRKNNQDTNDVFKAVFSESKPRVRKMLSGEMPITIPVKPTAKNLSDLMGLNKTEVNKLMGFSPSRKSRNEILDVEAIDRIYNALETRRRIEHFLGPDTDTWLQKPNKHLDNKSPLELIETRVGTQTLMKYLDSLESGHYL